MIKTLTPFLFLLLVSSTLVGQTKLEYKLKKEDVFTVDQNATQIITQELDGATHVLTNQINGILEFTVLNEVNTIYEVCMVFKDINLKITSSIQGEIMNIKAKEVKEGDLQTKIFNALLNTPVTMFFAKNGNIIKAQGGDSLVTKMANAAGIEDDFSMISMKKSLEKEFGSKALSDSYKQMTHFYPKDLVNIGDTWNNEYQGKLTTKNTWTLANITNTETIINGTADVVMKISEPNTTMNLKGTQETHITTNTANGFLKKMTVEGESKGVSIMTQMSDQEIPTTIKSIITYELIP